MNPIKLTLKQLLLLTNMSAILPIVAVIVGYSLASHSNDSHILHSSAINQQQAQPSGDMRSGDAEVERLEKAGDITELNEESIDTPFLLDDIKFTDALHEPIEFSMEIDESSTVADYSLRTAPDYSINSEDVYLSKVSFVDEQLGNYFAAQIGVFSDKNRAVKWAQEMRGKSVDARVFAKYKADSSELFSVVVGVFQDKSDAKDAGVTFTRRFGIPHYVTDANSFEKEIHLMLSGQVLATAF